MIYYFYFFLKTNIIVKLITKFIKFIISNKIFQKFAMKFGKKAERKELLMHQMNIINEKNRNRNSIYLVVSIEDNFPKE